MPAVIKAKKVPVNEDAWIDALDAIAINDERWWCMVTMLVETVPRHARYVTAFEEAAQFGGRRGIHVLSRRRLLSSVKLLSKPDLDVCPPIQGVCHRAYRELTADETLSPWLLARIVKYMVYRAREEAEARTKREAELEESVVQEMRIMRTVARLVSSDTAKRGKVERRGVPSGDAAKESAKKTSEKTESSAKNDTRLRKRGEEWRDAVRIDDAPLDGPDLYIVLTGFHDPALPRELVKIGVPLTSVLGTRIPGDESLVPMDSTSSNELFEFWKTFEKDARGGDAVLEYSDVMSETVCLPLIAGASDDETLKKEVYDNISFALYDLYDVRRRHVDYLRSMKLQPNLREERACDANTESYSRSMNLIPEECITVPTVLHALLAQVEANVPLPTNVSSLNDEAEERDDEDCAENKIGVRISRKCSSNSEIPTSGIQLVLYGDALRECTLNSRIYESQSSNVDLLINLKILDLWNRTKALTETEAQMYSHHLEDISQCYDRQPMDLESVRHHIHLMLLDEMIRGSKPPANAFSSSWSELDVNSSTVPSFTSRIELRRVRSDGAIEHSSKVKESLARPRLQALTNETPQPNFSATNEPLRELDSSQLLSPVVFLQTLHDCLATYNDPKCGYFRPTDSILLLFRDSRRGLVSRAYSASIRTPVCSRDFLKYVVDEERRWIARADARHRADLKRKVLKEMSTERTDIESSTEQLVVYTDRDFVLPGSLKAQDSEKTGSDDHAPASRAKGGKASLEDKREAREKGKERISSPPKKTLSDARCATEDEPWEFLGYDLGRFRVQVSGVEKTFASRDGTLVKVDLEEWLYGVTSLRIAVCLSECHLRMHRVLNSTEFHPFHLETKGGIILAFCELSAIAANAGQEHTPFYHPRFDFRASWPSGLLVELTPGDGPKNPFYVTQRYTSTNSERGQETCRKFLRNGTVLQFFKDGRVVALRPNGTRVTCSAFEKVKVAETDEPEGAEEFTASLGVDKMKRSAAKGSNPSATSKQTKTSSAAGGRRARTMTTSRRELFSQGAASQEKPINDSAVSMQQSRLKIERYAVLEHSGRSYEVFNDEIIKEHQPAMMRLTSDFEADERLIRWDDGTAMLWNSKGELVVSFTDGTRITTKYAIEQKPIERSSEDSVGDSRLNDESRESCDSFEEEFVSVLLTYRMEHENYATVTYDQGEIDCLLLMPGDVQIRMSRDGAYGVTVGSTITLEVEENSLTYTNEICRNCGAASTTHYQFYRNNSEPGTTSPSNDRYILKTTDSLGDVFMVHHDGITSHESDAENVEIDEGNRRLNGESTHCPHHIRADVRNDYRVFAMNRDLSAYEYVRRSSRIHSENETGSADESSLLLYPVSGRPTLRYRVNLTPLRVNIIPDARSRRYEVAKLRPTNRKRSTYVTPYNWIFPYGKRGDGIWRNTWEVPLNRPGDDRVPEVLVIGIYRDFRRKDEDVVVALRKALNRYRFTVFDEYDSRFPTKINSQREKSSVESWLKNLALGRITSIDVDTYFGGLAKNRIRKEPKPRSRPSRIAAIRTAGTIVRERTSWYEKCLSERIFIPYFVNIPGACLLWLEECLDRATNPAARGDASSSTSFSREDPSSVAIEDNDDENRED